jgi:hypothetical protein
VLCLLVRGGEVEAGAAGVFVAWPPGGDDFGAGVEGDAFGAVDVLVAEQRVLPAAEGVERHRDGTGTLMPIIPTWTPRWNLRAASPLEVKIAVPLP